MEEDLLDIFDFEKKNEAQRVLESPKRRRAIEERTNKASPMSFLRVSTDDSHGKLRAYIGEGRFTDDPLETFGGAGVAEIPHLQDLLQYICRGGFEHHVAANMSRVARAVNEAATQYLGWEMYWHPARGC